MHTICTVHMCMHLTPRYMQYIHALFNTYKYAHAGSLMGQIRASFRRAGDQDGVAGSERRDVGLGRVGRGEWG
jgi:hypothetical protein